MPSSQDKKQQELTKAYDVVAVGNAIVDILAHANDDFLKAENIEKGAMTLIDEARAAELFSKMNNAVTSSGGSAANTMAGFGSFGGKGAFIGKVAKDSLGEAFNQGMNEQGIAFNNQPLIDGPTTASCHIFVTPDAERSMNTFLGASTEFEETDLDETVIAQGRILYLEGYLYDKPKAKAAYKKASEIARKHGVEVALTLSDTFCVDRHRAEFEELVSSDVDILFSNEAEIKSLYQAQTLEEAISRVEGKCRIVVITRSEKGAVILSHGKRYNVPAHPVDTIIDTTGAGDQFAAGFLFGLSRGMTLEECGALGCKAAAEVISHFGPRPQTSYTALLA